MPQSLVVTLTFVINSVLQVVSASLPAGTVGQAYPSTSIGTVSGGVPPYTFTATGLPPGMALSSAGVLSGTPTSAGSFSVQVTITDSGT